MPRRPSRRVLRAAAAVRSLANTAKSDQSREISQMNDLLEERP